MRVIKQLEGNYMAEYSVDELNNITSIFRTQVSNIPIMYDDPPQTKEETMNEIDAAVVSDIVNYFRDHPHTGSVVECASALGYPLDTVAMVVRNSRQIGAVTVLADKVAPAIKDSLMTEDPGVGTKPIRTLAGTERDGAVHLPVLNDVKVEGREESAEEAHKVAAEKKGDDSRSDLKLVAEDIHMDHEQVRAFLFMFGKLFQSLTTEYDYGDDEDADKAWGFIENHKKAISFLCKHASEIQEIIDFEESEE